MIESERQARHVENGSLLTLDDLKQVSFKLRIDPKNTRTRYVYDVFYAPNDMFDAWIRSRAFLNEERAKKHTWTLEERLEACQALFDAGVLKLSQVNRGF